MIEKIEHAALTDVGMERSENQDSYGVSLTDGLDFYFVCDGMGGHAGGSTASTMAVDVITAHVEQNGGDPAELLGQAIVNANHEIFEKQVYERELRGMGTTVVAVAIDRENECAHFCHVGDSRAYLLRGDVLRRVSRDHTMVQQLVDDGVITAEEADVHPNSNVISRSLGGQPEVEVEHGEEPLKLEDGDIIMLCSDGLSGLITEMTIAEVLSEYDTDEAASRLIELANEAGGHDNITVEVIVIGDKPEPRTSFRIEHPPPAPGSRGSRALLDLDANTTPSPSVLGPGKTGDTVALDMSTLGAESAALQPADDPAGEADARHHEPLAAAAVTPAELAARPGRTGAAIATSRNEPASASSLRKALVAVAAILGAVFVALFVMYLLQGPQPDASVSNESASLIQGVA